MGVHRSAFAWMWIAGCTATSTPATGDGSSSSAATTDAVDSSSNASTTTASTSAAETIGDTSSALTTEGTTGLDDASSSSSSDETGAPTDPGPDLRELGPHAVEVSSASFPTGGCMMGYDVTAPVDVADAPTVVLAHGFQGNRASMAERAAHWASWGLVVVTPDLCHATILDADHAANGADLVALAGELGLDAPVYAGYSAGGLAAVLASAQDPSTRALLGLDMVDSGGLGDAVAAGIAVPAHDIVAEAAMCNSSANGVPVFAAIPGSLTVRIAEADHCDFQAPPDAFCNLCSAPNDMQDPETIQGAIRGLSTAALLWHTGVDARGATWWTPGGAWYDELVLSGVIAQL